MIQDKTTLILGAGASCHYGFPTGEGLITRVCIKCEAFKGWPQGPESFFQKFSNILNGEQDNEELSFMHHERQSFRERTAKQAEALKEKLDIFSLTSAFTVHVNNLGKFFHKYGLWKEILWKEKYNQPQKEHKWDQISLHYPY